MAITTRSSISVKAVVARMVAPRPVDNWYDRDGATARDNERQATAPRATVVVIEGPPCSGKTTLARRLGQALAAQLVLEPPGRALLPAGVRQRVAAASRELVMAVMQWRWLRRAQAAAGDRPVVADFSPLKAAVRLAAMKRAELALAAEALARHALGDNAAVVVLVPSAEVVVERWQRRGPDGLSAERLEMLRRLVEVYRTLFARPLAWPVLMLEDVADLEGMVRVVRAWLCSAGNRCG